MVEFGDCQEPLERSAIIALEARLQVRLPAPYRAHLLRYNGGWVHPRHFRALEGDGHSLVAQFLAVHDGEAANLERYARRVEGRLSEDLLPIAHDPFGNLICLGVSGGVSGEVYLWEPEADALHLLARDFDAFLAGLHTPEGPDAPGSTPLHRAGDPPTTRKLIRRGAHLDAVDDEGHTPLDKACIARRWDVAKLLIRAGADIHRSATALYGDWVDLAVRRSMLERGGSDLATELLLHWNTQLGEEHLALIALLLEFEPDLSAFRSSGAFENLGVLHRVACPAVIRLLVDAGADVDARDGDGWTPLHHAAEMWHDEGEPMAAEALLDAGADIDARTPKGQTALDLAIDDHVAELLRARGGRPGAQA